MLYPLKIHRAYLSVNWTRLLYSIEIKEAWKVFKIFKFCCIKRILNSFIIMHVVLLSYTCVSVIMAVCIHDLSRVGKASSFPEWE